MRKQKKEQQKLKKQTKRINYFRIITVFIVAYFLYTMYNQQIQINKYNSQIAMYSSNIESTQEKIDDYKSQESSISTDEYMEKVAREQLGYVKPYEKIFIDVNK